MRKLLTNGTLNHRSSETVYVAPILGRLNASSGRPNDEKRSMRLATWMKNLFRKPTCSWPSSPYCVCSLYPWPPDVLDAAPTVGFAFTTKPTPVALRFSVREAMVWAPNETFVSHSRSLPHSLRMLPR